MKKYSYLIFVFVLSKSIAQNTFPTSGFTGIGTTNPATLLDVRGTFRLGHYGQWWLRDNSGASQFVIGRTSNESDDNILFAFTQSGELAIGHRYPTAKLHVVQDNGVIRLSGSTYNSVDIFDGGTGDPGYIKTYYNGVDDNQIGAYGTYFAAQGGNVGIGTRNPTEKLSVNGNIKAKKLIVSQVGWPDYVFSKNYKLKPLSEVDQFIKTNKHLPDMPSAKEVEKRGLDVGKAQALLLKKIEELTLYLIAQQKELLQQKKQIENLQKKVNRK
jgi:hypothetical protein